MKNYIKSFLLVCCLIVQSATWAQNNRSPMDDMVNAIQNARVNDMAKYFDIYVPITINNVQSVYSRNQADAVLRDFFEKNTPKYFDVTDNGSPDNNSKFIIANFTASSGLKFNVYILMKMKGGDFIVQQLSLNKE